MHNTCYEEIIYIGSQLIILCSGITDAQTPFKRPFSDLPITVDMDSHLYTLLRRIIRGWQALSPHRCLEGCSLLPNQLSASFSLAGQTLQCDSPSRAPHPSLWDQAEAETRLLLKSHLCPPSSSASPASLSHLQVSSESFSSINHVHRNPHLRLCF